MEWLPALFGGTLPQGKFFGLSIRVTEEIMVSQGASRLRRGLAGGSQRAEVLKLFWRESRTIAIFGN